MSQPPYQPYPGQPDPEAGGGHQPPAAPGSYPPPSSGAGAYPPPPTSGAGSYPPPSDPGSYPPPASGAGAYPPPGGVPQYGSAPPPKKKSALKILLIVAGVVALLCVAGIGVAVFAFKDDVERTVDAAKITVVEPQTLGGRAKASDPALQSSVQGLDSEMAGIPGATSSVGAIYGDVQKQDIVMIAAASSITGTAQDRYDEFTKGLGQGGIKLDNVSDTDPGPLGGIAKCGDSDTAGTPMAVCVWSDNGSVGMIAMMFKGKADLQKEFIAMRGQIEQKS